MTALFRRRTTCRLCESIDLELVLALSPTPPANAFVKASLRDEPQELIPLDVFLCRGCGHVQLLDIVDPDVLFRDYVYVSGTSPVFVRHFQEYANQLVDRFRPSPGALAVEIGSNDGTMLGFLQKSGLEVLGIDPAVEISANARARGIETLTEFFDEGLAEEIVRGRGRAALVIANNVFAHADDLRGITAAIQGLLAPNGVFVFEVSYLVDVVEKTLFDTIYHEHLAYHSVAPLKRFFEAHGLDLFAVERVATHGGSLRGFVQRRGDAHKPDGSVERLVSVENALGLDRPETIVAFGADIARKGQALRATLLRLRSEGKRIAGYGAPAKATTLCHQFSLGSDILEYIIDDSPLKQGLLSPGYHVAILPASTLQQTPPDYLVILAWNFADAIIAKLTEFRAAGGQIIVPLPDLKLC